MSVRYYTIPPEHALKEYIRFFWVLESDTHYYMHQSMADVSPELVFHYKGYFHELMPDGSRKQSFTSGIHGQTINIHRFQIHESFGIFGVYLFPYTLPALFGIPAIEMTNGMADLRSLLGIKGTELEEKVMTAKSNHERIGVLSSFFMDKLKSAGNHESAIFSSVRFMMQSKGLIKVKDVADEFCLSERQFERKFKENIGLTPKIFSRVVRFGTAFQEYNNREAKTLTQIAHDCGYYDQAHFIRDFKLFSGFNPKTFFTGKAEGVDWVNG